MLDSSDSTTRPEFLIKFTVEMTRMLLILVKTQLLFRSDYRERMPKDSKIFHHHHHPQKDSAISDILYLSTPATPQPSVSNTRNNSRLDLLHFPSRQIDFLIIKPLIDQTETIIRKLLIYHYFIFMLLQKTRERLHKLAKTK